MPSKSIPSLCFVAMVAAAPAQQLVRELNPAPTQNFSTLARQLTGDGQRVFFTASTNETDEALYVTDGTVGGSRLFKDLPAGAVSSGNLPFPLGFLGSELVFSLQDEVWITDPTPTATTFLTAGIRNGASSLRPLASVGQVGTRFLFADGGGAGTNRLWATDGSPQGTQILASIGVDRSLVVGTRAFLSGVQVGTGWELWVSDGTAVGTTLVVDQVANGDSHPTAFAALGGALHYLASLANGDTALWRSDGTAAGTVMIRSFPGFQLAGANAEMVEGSGRLLFAVGNALWSSDGTPAGTQLVRAGLSSIASLRTIGNQTWFTAADASGRELWLTDGTTAGTRQLLDLTPGAAGSSFSKLVDVGGRLLTRTFASGSWGLLASDGTSAGTSTFAAPGPIIVSPAELVAIGSRGVFNTTSGIYVTDGTAAGTAPLLQPGVYRPGVVASNGTALGDQLLFFANDGSTGRELWRTDGSAANTVQVADLFPGSGNGIQSDAEMLAMDGYVYFTTGTVASGNGQAYRPKLLYRTDGTSAGTVALTQYQPGLNIGGQAHGLQVHDHALYFVDATPSGLRLFRTDGSTGAQQLPRVTIAAGSQYLVADGLVYYFPDSYLLWRTDGTASGTFQLASQATTLLGEFGGDLVFRDAQGVNITDGTVAGTQRLHSGSPSVGSSTAIGWFAGAFYWLQRDYQMPANLMRTDGTAAGTTVVAAFQRPQQFVVGQDAIYLIEFDATGGNELWRSDGTTVGTARVVDLAPGREPGALRLSVCGAGNRLFLAATDGVTGLEPWISDGTAVGTVQLLDGNPNGSGNPNFLGVAGERCYFLLDDGVRGIELWQAPVTAVGAAVVQSLGRGCPGAAGVPELGANGLPLVGAATFGLELGQVPPNSFVVGVIGTERAATVLPSGCMLWPAGAQATLFTFAGFGGTASFPLPIPAAAGLLGVQLTAQGGALDAFGTALPGVSLSNALILVVGD